MATPLILGTSRAHAADKLKFNLPQITQGLLVPIEEHECA